MSNLDRIWSEQRARFSWLHEMFASKPSRILFAVWTVAMLILGAFLG